MNKPIGVFDSGIGGLTVVSEIVRALPHESLIFLGDTARVPYGNRGVAVITQFARELAGFMLEHEVKYLVAACNTISSSCIEAIQEMSPVPVLGVVEPAVREAVQQTRQGKVGVIGTRATISSGFYEQQIRKLNPDIEVFSQACPLFVPLAEEGLIHAEATRQIAQDYLRDLSQTGIDVLILGCTHYPILRQAIQGAIGEGVTLVDSAVPTARELSVRLQQADLLADDSAIASYQMLVTDAPNRVGEVAAAFFGEAMPAPLRETRL